MEPLEAIVVHVELPVHQHRNPIVCGERIELLHLRRVALHTELLLGDDHGAALQIPFDLPRRALDIRHLVGAVAKCFRMGPRKAQACVIAERLRLQAVRHPRVRGGGVHRPAGGQENGRRHTHGQLMREQHVIGPAAVAEMLMDVDNRVGPGRLHRRA